MINKITYFNVDTDLSIKVDPNNNMQLIVSIHHYKDEFNDIVFENVKNIFIPFTPDTKYNKLISIYLMKDGKLIVDEPFDDYFYLETPTSNKIDKICWFNIPKNYNDLNGLNNIEIYAKGGNNDGY